MHLRIHFTCLEERGGTSATGSISGEGKMMWREWVVAVPLDLFYGMGRVGRFQGHWIHSGGWGERGGCSATGSISGDGERGIFFPIRIHAFLWKNRHSSLGPQKVFKNDTLIIQNWPMKSTFSFQNTFSKYHLLNAIQTPQHFTYFGWTVAVKFFKSAMKVLPKYDK